MKIVQLGTGKVLWEDASLANLSGADLHRANLSVADLSGADLHRANLSEAHLSGANLSGADLSGADLHRANLSVADLSGANLSGADLSGADLSGADLHRADLSGADLSGANLSGADLSGANLIVGGIRSDGYQFMLVKEPNGALKVRAGCRYFSFKEGHQHWVKTRNGTRLGNESLCLMWHLEEMAKIAGWIK